MMMTTYIFNKLFIYKAFFGVTCGVLAMLASCPLLTEVEAKILKPRIYSLKKVQQKMRNVKKLMDNKAISQPQVAPSEYLSSGMIQNKQFALTKGDFNGMVLAFTQPNKGMNGFAEMKQIDFATKHAQGQDNVFKEVINGFEHLKHENLGGVSYTGEGNRAGWKMSAKSPAWLSGNGPKAMKEVQVQLEQNNLIGKGLQEPKDIGTDFLLRQVDSLNGEYKARKLVLERTASQKLADVTEIKAGAASQKWEQIKTLDIESAFTEWAKVARQHGKDSTEAQSAFTIAQDKLNSSFELRKSKKIVTGRKIIAASVGGSVAGLGLGALLYQFAAPEEKNLTLQIAA